MRGAYTPLVGGLLVLGPLTLAGVNGQAEMVSMTIGNAQGLGGNVFVYQSVNGAAYSRVGNLQYAPFVDLVSVFVGGPRFTGEVVRSYIDCTDARGELLGRSNVAQRTWP